MQTHQSPSEPLQLHQITKQLFDEEWLSREDADTLIQSPKGSAQSKLHPLEVIANAQLKTPAGETITLDALMHWLAKMSRQAFFQIDPLKIDSQKIAGVMSFAFAKRHAILAVEIHTDEVVIASTQPFVSNWESDLKHTLKKDIRRVLVNPEELRKYTIEFYELANSVNKAGAQTASQGYTQNFEQMLELGSQSNPDANDQHIINIVDWLLQ